MKRYLVWLIVILSIVAFNGCSSEEDYDDDMISLFLVDKDGYSAGGDVPYRCVDENNNIAGQWLTRPNGEFSFYAGERCTFGFDGYDGTPDPSSPNCVWGCIHNIKQTKSYQYQSNLFLLYNL